MSSVMLSTPLRTAEQFEQNWKTLFPDFSTLEGSCLFIKKLIAVSLSSITYIRRIFPERAYGERDLSGLKIKLLTEDCGISSVSKFINLIRSCYDAVDKKYLQQLTVGICPDPENKEEVIEAYNLVFRYTDDECSITCHNGVKTSTPLQSNSTVQATFLLLKSINAISERLGDLPKKAYIVIKLLYYDEVTPSDYQPLGFEPSSVAKFTFSGKTTNIKLGKVVTDKHGYQFLLKTTTFTQPLSQSVSEDPIVEPMQSLQIEKDKVSTDNVLEDLHISQQSQSRNELKTHKSVQSLNCPCQQKSETDTIKCISCERKQHKSCYGILKSDDIPKIFYCVDCILHNSDGNTPLDLIYLYQGKERQEFCAMRRALAFCCTLRTVTSVHFEKQFGCTKSVAKMLLEHLESEGFITKGSKQRYTVEKSRIYEFGLPQYFSSKENNENDAQLPKFSDNGIDEGLDSAVENLCFPPEHPTSVLENSMKKITALNAIYKSPDAVHTRTSQKRKASCKAISPAPSDELFQSQKRTRTQRRI